MTDIGTFVMLRLEARQREIITLSGTSGTANITAAGGLTKLVTFATDLATTAANFVASHAAAYLAAGIVVTCSGEKLCFVSSLVNNSHVAPIITNATGNLAGTVAVVNPVDGEINLIGETSTSLKSAQTMIDVSNKLSLQNSTFKAGRIARTISVTSIASTDTATTGYGYDDALQCQAQKVPVDFTLTEYDAMGVPVVGAILIYGTTLISNVSDEIPDNDKLTFSLDLQIDNSMIVDINP